MGRRRFIVLCALVFSLIALGYAERSEALSCCNTSVSFYKPTAECAVLEEAGMGRVFCWEAETAELAPWLLHVLRLQRRSGQDGTWGIKKPGFNAVDTYCGAIQSDRHQSQAFSRLCDSDAVTGNCGKWQIAQYTILFPVPN